MVIHTIHLWGLGGWFIIAIPTLPQMDVLYLKRTPLPDLGIGQNDSEVHFWVGATRFTASVSWFDFKVDHE